MSLMPYEVAMSERKVLVKQESVTNPDFGKNPSTRTIEELLESSIVNINKPKAPTSHEVSEFVKNILHVKKAGQSGTLDPAVTGVLPIGIERCTRALSALLKAGKEYICVMHLHDDLSEEQIKKVMSKFVGTIKQLPPVKSAVKRQIRDRKIYYIDIIEIKDRDVLFRVGCQAGTYIRKLCDDIGKNLGSGAHMAQLIRTKVGIFSDNDMVTLQELSDAYYEYENNSDSSKLMKLLRPIEDVVEHLPKVWVHDSAVWYLCNGGLLAVPGISKLTSDISDSVVAVFTLKNEFIGLGKAIMSAKKIMGSEKGFAIKIESVLMKSDVYPKIKNETSQN